jgi:hypothetical protein
MFELTKSKFRILSTLFANFSEVFLASLVIPVIIGGVEKFRLPIILLGITGTISWVILSLITAERGKL